MSIRTSPASRNSARIALAIAASVLAAPRALALDSELAEIARKDIPAAVAKLVGCGTEPERIDRRAFAGGFIFAWPCPGNHANWMTALVFAPREDGEGARVLRLPPPNGKAWNESSNVEYFAKTRELTQIMVDPERRGPCRREGRWRLEGPSVQPKLMFWRETRDCEGRRGWRIVVRNGKRAE